MTPVPESAHQLMRQAALDVAAEEVLANGWDGLQMRAVATRVGVSRQTLYNTFSSKHGLADALIQRLLGEFLDGIDATVAAVESAPDGDVLRARWSAVMRYSLDKGAEDPLLTAFLTGTSSDEFLPLLTTDGSGVVVRARQHLSAMISAHHPDLDHDRVTWTAETVSRMVISHIVLPLHPIEQVAEFVGHFAAAGCPAVPTPG